jgi:ribonuclease BN (tRNA processing enzyme)
MARERGPMKLTILGRSPARPNPGEACAGYLVEGGGARVLLDVGPGVVSQLLRRAQPTDLDAVVVSHMHTDHFLDLVTLRYAYPWLEVAPRRLRVILPPGSREQLRDVARGSGFPEFFDRSFEIEEHDGEHGIEVASSQGALRLDPVETKHFIPTWGFRIAALGEGEVAGRVLAYSADTAPCPSLHGLADGASLFLCEAGLRSLDEESPVHGGRGHLLPSEAGEAAAEASVERLLLTHLPIGEDGGTWAREEAARAFAGPVEVAAQLTSYEV